jgi:hypothetical protein
MELTHMKMQVLPPEYQDLSRLYFSEWTSRSYAEVPGTARIPCATFKIAYRNLPDVPIDLLLEKEIEDKEHVYSCSANMGPTSSTPSLPPQNEKSGVAGPPYKYLLGEKKRTDRCARRSTSIDQLQRRRWLSGSFFCSHSFDLIVLEQWR